MNNNELQVGSVVNYSDQMNNSTFVVIAITDDQWSPLKLRNVDDFTIEFTDGRQSGWKVMAA